MRQTRSLYSPLLLIFLSLSPVLGLAAPSGPSSELKVAAAAAPVLAPVPTPVLASVTSSAPSVALPLSPDATPAPAPVGARGDLIKIEKLPRSSWSLRAVNLAKVQMKLSADYKTNSRVDVYQITYRTWDHHQKLTLATGLVMVPSDIKEALPILSYQHATRFGAKASPSDQPFDPEVQAAAIFFASEAYLVVMPDYLGLGKRAETSQFYLNSDIQAISIADLLQAAKTFFNEQKIAYTPDLYLAGYSQGGHATLSLHRYLQEHQPNDFHIVASAALSAPLGLSDLTRAVFNEEKKIQIDPVFLAVTILGMEEAYDFFPRLKDILQEPYATTLPHILRTGTFSEISAQLPHDMKNLFNWLYVLILIADQSAESPFWRALAMNDVDNFLPNAPVLLVHSPTDNVVPFFSSSEAYRKLSELGATITLKELDPKWVDHTEAALPALNEAANFFRELRLKQNH